MSSRVFSKLFCVFFSSLFFGGGRGCFGCDREKKIDEREIKSTHNNNTLSFHSFFLSFFGFSPSTKKERKKKKSEKKTITSSPFFVTFLSFFRQVVVLFRRHL